ncbi:hypothetical protein IFR35_23785 [Pseudomonas fluorescens]|uniref:hypothetical protein n=1 Tax=Pseudomonas fluorescens TaxID=294 RepID=UPI0017837EEC|nr:hypothetical protein [Pseudomonas fluorescens]MBD8194422.1 hypothetical protein [Pseudomonas fluorescens]MBD8229143.1 hypothetical protein [Pseudomonas fluorescens]MBD8787232.1 hypothetical protein [Pseudomonas fluorescens]MBD8819584.1 hypothetical protein [Pseudomonas fluorescens]
MESFSIPPTIFVAFGVITAALLAGFFSYLNLVSAKENKVSEFRLAWIDGLREEIATYTAAVRELVRVDGNKLYEKNDTEEKTIIELRRERHLETRDAYGKVVESLSKIQMRLNPTHIKEYPDGPEAKLMANILKTRQLFNDRRYSEAGTFSDDIRDSATPLLKVTWDLVKNGEPGYQKIRTIAARTIIVGMVLVGVTFFGLCITAFVQVKTKNQNLESESSNSAQAPVTSAQPNNPQCRCLEPSASEAPPSSENGNVNAQKDDGSKNYTRLAPQGLSPTEARVETIKK